MTLFPCMYISLISNPFRENCRNFSSDIFLWIFNKSCAGIRRRESLNVLYMWFCFYVYFCASCIRSPILVAERSKRKVWGRTRVRIPPAAWMSVCCECCVLSGRGLCDWLIPGSEELCLLSCVIVSLCVITETLRMRRPWPALGSCGRDNIC